LEDNVSQYPEELAPSPTLYSNGHNISPDAKIGAGTIIQAGAVIERGCKVGSFCRIGYNAVLREGTMIGDHSVFGSLSASEGHNKIGNHVTIHSQCHITEGVEIEDWVFIAPFFCGANTRKIVHGRNFQLVKTGYKIKYGARIGIGVLVAPGIVIGREALVDMGSLVTKDVPDYSHVRGFPAKVIRLVPEDEHLRF